MKRKTSLFLILILVLAMTMMISACSETSDDAQQSDENGTVNQLSSEDADITADDTNVKYESKDGNTNFEVDTENSVDLPEDYPSDIIPVYPNGRVTIAGKEGDGFAIAIVTDDSISDVFQYYKENNHLDMVAGEQNTGDMAMIMGTANGMNVTVMVTVNNMYDEGKNLISIAMGN